MAKSVSLDNRKRIWVFGRCYDFHIVSTDIRDTTSNQVLTQEDFRHSSGMSPDRRQKTQIVLHCTASNNPAENVIRNTWHASPGETSPTTASAHFVLERTNAGHADRPPLPTGVPASDKNDAAFTDVVRIMDDDTITYHAESVNACSIGIEIANAANTWQFVYKKHEPSLNDATGRPDDLNRFIKLPARKGSNVPSGDYLTLQEEQYSSLILLLRHLCITHRIPRVFLGLTTEEMYKPFLWRHTGDEQSRKAASERIHHFRGILHHRNVNNPKDRKKNGKMVPSGPKPCPGILNRNRIFRGITDNWWMPVDIDGTLRNYYTGPIDPLPWKAGEETQNAYFRPSGDRSCLEGTVMKNADIDALSEARHYFDCSQTDLYYAITESKQGGCFPVGSNLMWHGGVHIPVSDANPWVYAAACGTIVAARLNPSDTPTDAVFGSQRFILIRHAVYPYTEPDVDCSAQQGNGNTSKAKNTDLKIKYTDSNKRDKNGNPENPVYIFSLYMHMAPFVASIDEKTNPPWFNIWRRTNPDADIDVRDGRGIVFAPNMEVSLGDILGRGGMFRGGRKIHFEIIGHRDSELKIIDNDPFTVRTEDTDENAMCNADAINSLIDDVSGDGVDRDDIFRAASRMRNVKVLHMSEWALTDESQIEVLVPNKKKRSEFWPHLHRFSWFKEATSANPDLSRQLGEKGFFWHYHPITFMKYMNELVHKENFERDERSFTVNGGDPLTNVEIDENNFFAGFVAWNKATKTFDTRTSGGKALKPNDVSSAGYGYSFTDNDISCCRCADNTHKRTHLSVGLLEVVERIKGYHKGGMEISCSYLCSSHTADTSACVLRNTDAATEHSLGIAIDIKPSGASPSQKECEDLWTSVRAVVNGLMENLAQDLVSGDILQNGFPEGYCDVAFSTDPSIKAKLEAKPPIKLTANECSAFAIHLSLVKADSARRSGGGAGATDGEDSLWVGITSIKVINDEDWFGKGEWELDAVINDESCGMLKQKVKSGTVIDAPQSWRREVNIRDGNVKAITVEIRGKEIDLIWDDDLGFAKARFKNDDSPAWGVGRHTLKSSEGCFEAVLIIGSKESMEGGTNGDDIVPQDNSLILPKISDVVPKKLFGF